MTLASLLLTSCLSYALVPPAPSGLSLDLPPDPAPVAIGLVDERTPADRALKFVEWDSFGNYPEEKPPIDPPYFLAVATQRELASRGLPVTIGFGGDALPRIHLRRFRVRGYRDKSVLQGDELVARVLLSADLETASGRKRIGVYTAGSAGAGLEQIVGDPLSLAVKEFAAKLANELGGYRSNDQTVDEISGMVASYQNIYALGFTNNPAAIPRVTELARAAAMTVAGEPLMSSTRGPARQALIASLASLGTLRATEEFPRLRGVYENRNLGWRPRSIAAKSIGDLGTSEALDYLSAQIASGTISPASERGGLLAQVIELYL